MLVPPIANGPNLKIYAKVPCKSSVVTRPIPIRFKMQDITKYDGTRYSQEYLLFFRTVVNGNYVIMEEIESMMVK